MFKRNRPKSENKRSSKVDYPVAGILSEGFCSRLSSGAIGFALPLYARQLGLSFAEISILISLNLIVGMLLKPLAGPIVDHYGHRFTSVIALASRSALYLLLAAAGAVWHLALIQSVRGVTKSVRDPALYALLAKHGSKKHIASTFAWYHTAKSSAGSFGHTLAGFLLTLTAGSYSSVFAVAAAIAFLPCVILPLLISKKGESDQPPEMRTVRAVTRDRKSKKPRQFDLAPYVGFGFIVSATSRMLRRMMPLLLVEYAGLAEAEAGSLYLVAAVVTLIAAPVFGWLYDHVSPKLVLMTRSLMNATSSLIYILSPTYAGFTVGKVLDKSGTSAFRPAWGALMAEASAANPRHRAGRIAIMSAGEDAGAVCGPILAGVLWSAFGPVPMLAARLALALSAEVYTLFFTRWIERRKSVATGPTVEDFSNLGQSGLSPASSNMPGTPSEFEDRGREGSSINRS